MSRNDTMIFYILNMYKMLCICIIGELINTLSKKLINELKIDILRAKLELNFSFFLMA